MRTHEVALFAEVNMNITYTISRDGWNEVYELFNGDFIFLTKYKTTG